MADVLSTKTKKIGWKKTTAWGTATEPTTGDQVNAITFTPPTGERNFYHNNLEAGQGGISDCLVPLDFLEVTADLTRKFKYEGCEKELACLYGGYAIGTPPEVGAVLHEYTFKEEIDASDMALLLHTLTYDEGDEVKVVPSTVVKEGGIDYDEGYNLNLNYLGDRVSIASGYTQPIGVTLPSACGGGLFKLSESVVRINTDSGGALGSGDTVTNLSNIEWTITRGSVTLPQVAGTNYVAQPEENDETMMTVTLTYNKKDALNKVFFADYQAGTTKKMDITFTGETIPTLTTPYSFTQHFPRLEVMDPALYGWETPTETTIVLKVMKATAAPTGMTSTLPYAELVNTVTGLTGYPT